MKRLGRVTGGDGYFFLATSSDTVWRVQRVQREANRPPVKRGDRGKKGLYNA